jgi:hypothetical protein
VKVFDLMLECLYDEGMSTMKSLDEAVRRKGISGRRNERTYLGRESGKNLVE